MHSVFRLAALLAFAAAVAGCATTPQATASNPADPWEESNRRVFAFNDKLDQAVLKPVAEGYRKVVPGFAQEGVNNFFGNLNDVGTSINNVLQGKPKEGFSDAARVVVNTVLGVFGLWDVATPMGLEKHEEDFGQTLGVWGMQSGPYLVLPFLGPSSARDAPARVVDPNYFWGYYIDNSTVAWSLTGVDLVRTRANLLQAETVLQQAALDKYSFIRDAWLQRRRNQVYDGNPPRVKEEE